MAKLLKIQQLVITVTVTSAPNIELTDEECGAIYDVVEDIDFEKLLLEQIPSELHKFVNIFVNKNPAKVVNHGSH
jgi:hypothetical protein